MVGKNKIIIDVAYEEFGVARSHFGHCNTADLIFVVVVAKYTVKELFSFICITF